MSNTHFSSHSPSAAAAAIKLNSASYPPSPPASAEALTIANVATLPSSYSTISTIVASDQSDSDSEQDVSEASSFSASSEALSIDASDAFLRSLFGSGYKAEFARHGMKTNAIDSGDMDGAVLESFAHATKTLYCAPSPSKLDREGLVDLMELAADQLDCSGLIICLSKSDKELEETLHSLLYVGGAIIPPGSSMIKFADHLVLVGLDL